MITVLCERIFKKVPKLHGWLFGILLIIPSYNLQSQINDKPNPWWVNMGAGPAMIGSSFALNAGMVYSYQFERSIISARIIGITNNNPTVQRIDRSSTVYNATDYGILYGPTWQFESSYISLGAGIGLVRVSYAADMKDVSTTSVSLPLEMQWFWRPTHFAGAGIYVYSNINFEKLFTGMMLSVQLGMW